MDGERLALLRPEPQALATTRAWGRSRLKLDSEWNGSKQIVFIRR